MAKSGSRPEGRYWLMDCRVTVALRKRPWNRELEVRQTAAVYDQETDTEDKSAARPWEKARPEDPYVIQMPKQPGWAHCPRCEVHFSAAGPTGHLEGQPICDLCLLEGSNELGMVMALVAVTRTFANYQPFGPDDYRDAQAELGAFARIYERFAAKSGPPRYFRLPGSKSLA